MKLDCVSPGIRENYPEIPIVAPTFSAPLICNGTILRGLWPYDADNMTFSIDTMFRDPALSDNQANPTINSTVGILNSIYMSCIEFRLRPLKAYAASEDVSGELAACVLNKDDIKSSNYVGLNLMVCVNTNPALDPTCKQGQWITVIDGACLGETVRSSVALQD